MVYGRVNNITQGPWAVFFSLKSDFFMTGKRSLFPGHSPFNLPDDLPRGQGAFAGVQNSEIIRGMSLWAVDGVGIPVSLLKYGRYRSHGWQLLVALTKQSRSIKSMGTSYQPKMRLSKINRLHGLMVSFETTGTVL